jgi:hypothetical protein
VSFVINGLIKGEIEKPSGQYLGLICDESLISRDLNSNLGHSNGSTILSCLCGESWLLVSWCAGSRCDTVDNDEDRGTSRRSDVEDQRWSSTGRVLGDRAIGGSGDTVCGLYCAHGDEEHGFFG